MNGFKNKKLTSYSQNLRKNMTKEERHLWYDFLKQLPITVHCQKVITPYIVDFYIPKEKIVIELDGSQHFKEKGILEDRQCDAFLKSLGIRIFRYSNIDVNQNFRAVCEDILSHINCESYQF